MSEIIEWGVFCMFALFGIAACIWAIGQASKAEYEGRAALAAAESQERRDR